MTDYSIYSIVQRITFTITSIGALEKEFPKLIADQLAKLEEQMAEYDDLQTQKRGADGKLYRFRRVGKALIEQYYPVIGACFAIVRAAGKDTRNLYFKQETPSQLIRNNRRLERWVRDVLNVMEYPKNRLLDLYHTQLINLRDELDHLLNQWGATEAVDKETIQLRKKMLQRLSKTYRILKFYLMGWLEDEGIDPRPYFKEFRLTPKRRRKQEQSFDETVLTPEPVDQQEKSL